MEVSSRKYRSWRYNTLDPFSPLFALVAIYGAFGIWAERRELTSGWRENLEQNERGRKRVVEGIF